MTVVTISGPNGSDDAAQFNAALATIKAAGIGGTIRVDANAGPYQIQTPIIWDSLDGVTLCSAGTRATLNLSSTGKLNVTNATNCTVRDLVFNCVSGWSANASLFAQAATHFTVRGCAFVGGGHQIFVVGVNQSIIASSTFTGLTVAGSCVIAGECTDLVLADLHASQITYPADAYAKRVFQASACHNVQVIGSSISGVDMSLTPAGAGLTFSGTTGANVVGFNANGVISGDGIATELGGSTKSTKITFSNCVSNSNGNGSSGHNETGDGFDIFHSEDVSIIDCIADNNGSWGPHPGVEIFYSDRVSVHRTSSQHNGDTGVAIASAIDTSLVDLTAAYNGNSGCYMNRARDDHGNIVGGPSQNLRIVGGHYSFNGVANNLGPQYRQGIYLSDDSTARIVNAELGRINGGGAPSVNIQEYGLFNANDSVCGGLHLLVGGNLTGYYTNQSTGSLTVDDPQFV